LSFTEAAITALQAGCDLAMLCNQSLPGSAGGGKAVDELIEGLTEAQVTGKWEPREASEERRVSLLPRQQAIEWDELMVQPAYMHALDWIA